MKKVQGHLGAARGILHLVRSFRAVKTPATSEGTCAHEESEDRSPSHANLLQPNKRDQLEEAMPLDPQNTLSLVHWTKESFLEDGRT